MQKKVLIVIGHPKPTSYNHAILEVCKKELCLKKCQVEVRDLYQLKFKPYYDAEDMDIMSSGTMPKDIAEEQKWIDWCDLMILIHPIWLSSFPAIVKAYIERVFCLGYAYKMEEGHVKKCLGGKTILILNTHGNPASVYSPFYEPINLLTNTAIFEWCAMKVINHHYFDGIPYITREQREQKLIDISKIMKELVI